jgi:hypothetical protein
MDVRRRRLAEAGAIIDRMIALDGTDPQVVTAASAYLRGQPGDENAAAADAVVENAIETLRTSLTEQLSEQERLTAEMRLARVLAVKAEQALATGGTEGRAMAADLIAEAVELEGDRSSDIDTIAASIFMRSQMLAEAVPHQRRLLAEREAAGLPANELKEIARRLVEVLVAINDVDAAAPLVDQYFRS